MGRPTKFTVAVTARLAAMRQAGLNARQMSDELARNGTIIHPDTIRRFLAQLGDEAEVRSVANGFTREAYADSLKRHVLRLIDKQGPFPNEMGLPRLLAFDGRPGVDIHSLRHALNVLERQGLIEFQRRQVGSAQRYLRIKVTAQGQGWTSDDEAPAQQATETTGSDALRATILPEVERDAAQPEWPALQALREREREREEIVRKADLLAAKAAEIDEEDREAASWLLTRAANSVSEAPTFTEAEREFLEYARWCERKERA